MCEGNVRLCVVLLKGGFANQKRPAAVAGAGQFASPRRLDSAAVDASLLILRG